MLSTSEWKKIKNNLKEEIEPIFTEANIQLVAPFDEIFDVFQALLEKRDVDNSIDGRDDIEVLLQHLYCDGNHFLVGSTLDLLSGKLEALIKKIFRIAGEPATSGGQGMLADVLKTLFRRQRINGQVDFLNFTEQYITDFFNKQGPHFANPLYFLGAHPLGNHFKVFYQCRNEEGHEFVKMRKSELFAKTEIILAIYFYITNLYYIQLRPKTIHEPDHSVGSKWNVLKQLCGNFDKSYSYFLLTDRLNLTKDELSNFKSIKWSFVFDLDVDSESSGLLDAIQAANDYPQAISQIVHTPSDRGDIITNFPDNTSFWYFVKGNSVLINSLVSSSEDSAWRSMYGRYTVNLMIKFYEQKYCFDHRPIKVLILSRDSFKIREIIYSIKEMNSMLNIEFIFANDDNSQVSSVANENNSKIIDIPSAAVASGFGELAGTMFSGANNQIALPCHSSKGKQIILESRDVTAVRQYFSIIHLGILAEVDHAPEKSFYQGRRINWRELDDHIDVDRSITDDLAATIRNLLEKRVESAIVRLLHYPGVGGSTVARRVAYLHHRTFPVLILNETVTSYDETVLVEKLLRVSHQTELPILVLVDNSNISPLQIEMLERVVGSRLAKTVFLVVESTFAEPHADEKQFYIPATLDKKEADRFVRKFSEKYRNKNFESILSDQSPNVLTPFYFGLIAHERHYISITEYVQKRLDDITETEVQLLSLLSFCQIFAKGKLREVPHYIIARFLKINEDYIRLRRHTENDKIYDLILETDDLSWKIIHPLIAQTLLKLILGADGSETIRPHKLREFAIGLIESLREISDHRSESVLELLHNLFIQRDDDDEQEEKSTPSWETGGLYNSKLFSKLINDLNNNSNRKQVFTTLTDLFPNENAHFWAHFARLNSINRDFGSAVELINKALSIEEDYIFFHIKGMCFRAELYVVMDSIPTATVLEEAQVVNEKIYSLFACARTEFEKARGAAPNREHGYISFVQMVEKMINFQFLHSRYKNRQFDYTEFIAGNSWCREILMEANEVILDYRELNDDVENTKIREKQLMLLKYFGEKEKIVASWQTLLGNTRYDQNMVRRQVSFAIMAKNEFDLSKAKGKDIRRIIELIEQNLVNLVEQRDLQTWFEVSRYSSFNLTDLINKMEEWDFDHPSLKTAFYLMCLYGVQAVTGIPSGHINYDKSREVVQKREKPYTYSKVFCPEWIGWANEDLSLVNHRLVGKWSREQQFFENPTGLKRVQAKVIRYVDRNKGYLEIESSGLQVLYQPGKINHYSDDAQKQTLVDCYVGFNYDGARAFDVKNVTR
ncbi:hypothetical protein [Dyadobacter sp. 22481]|uniref:hypothetical protein n=1 Tax=Dyadobacter sp. 22481 TaxID=3453926 RepID=UPI003F82C3F9